MNSFKCYLFDLDGTLVDTSELIVKSIQQALNIDTGININREMLLSCLKESPIKILKKYGVNKLNNYWKYYYENLHLAQLYFDNTESIISNLKKSGAQAGIVSSLPKSKIEIILKRCQINRYFDCVIGWGDTARKKPYPDPILAAINKISAKAEKTAYIGDTENDMLAAKAAGVFSILATWNCYREIHNIESDAIIDRLSDLSAI